MPPSPATVCFFLPGLAHQFGNLLLTIQGQVLHVDADSIGRVCQAVLTATDRGAASLQVLRALTGEPVPAAAEAGELLTLLVELARVPVRERGRKIELRGQLPSPAVAVATGPFVAAVAETVRVWVEALPAGGDGTVVLDLAASAGQPGCRLLVGFEPVEGALPFPLAAADVSARLAPALGDHAVVGARADGLEVVFPAAAISSVWEA